MSSAAKEGMNGINNLPFALACPEQSQRGLVQGFLTGFARE
jgi:hypothetical protein